MERRSDGKFWFGFFVGGLLGALVLFFLGTKEGKKTGKFLEKKGEGMLDDLGEALKELEKKGKELVERGEELKEKVVEEIGENKKAISNEVSKQVDSALSHIESIQERGRQTTANLRRTFKNLPKKS